jgi:hypothetical protein
VFTVHAEGAIVTGEVEHHLARRSISGCPFRSPRQQWSNGKGPGTASALFSRLMRGANSCAGSGEKLARVDSHASTELSSAPRGACERVVRSLGSPGLFRSSFERGSSAPKWPERARPKHEAIAQRCVPPTEPHLRTARSGATRRLRASGARTRPPPSVCAHQVSRRCARGVFERWPAPRRGSARSPHSSCLLPPIRAPAARAE